jgi:hypothetical protein
VPVGRGHIVGRLEDRRVDQFLDAMRTLVATGNGTTRRA